MRGSFTVKMILIALRAQWPRKRQCKLTRQPYDPFAPPGPAIPVIPIPKSVQILFRMPFAISMAVSSLTAPCACNVSFETLQE